MMISPKLTSLTRVCVCCPPSLSNFEILLCRVSPSFQSQNGWEAEEFVETMVRLQPWFSMVFPCFGSSLLRLSSWYCNQTRSTNRCHGGPAESLGSLRWHVGQEASKQLLLTTKANAVLILPFTYIYTSFCTSISITVLSSNLNMSLRHSIGIHSEGIFSAKWTKRCPNPTRVMSPTFGYCCVA